MLILPIHSFRPFTIITQGRTITNTTIVGFESDEKTVAGYLTEQKEKLGVISITGIPGRGKTTLARKVYESKTVVHEFPIRIWTHVSRNSKYKSTYRSILKHFTSEDMSILNEQELCETICACLDTEKFLLVVDNLSSSEDWEAIKKVLPVGNNKGKVLVTSHNDYVGEDSDVSGKGHQLQGLTPEESWKLLQLEVFGNLESRSKELEEIGLDIASKCGGLPLLILAVAGILEPTVDGWKKVSENVNLLLRTKTSLSDVMELTYSMLPDELRDCFLYMGVFPEDWEISASTLTRMWIAEGFIQPRNGVTLEEMASRNLHDLINRKLVMASKINSMGEVKTCRLHDMVREICLIKSKEQNFVQEINKPKETGALDVEQFHRLCLHSNISKFLSRNPKGPKVRSLLCFSEEPMRLGLEYLSVIPDGFPKLRILESKSVQLSKFPAKTFKLIHLRYLTLHVEGLKVLPESVTQIWNLQSLVVETKSRLITMKGNLWSLIRLRYFKTDAAVLLDSKLEGGAGQNLHTLNRLAPESCTEVVSQRAKNLKTLGISGKLTPIFETKFLEELHLLENLKLVSSVTYEETSGDTFYRLPKRNCFPPNLKRLTLKNTLLKWENMSTLAMIRRLEVLKLKDNAFVGFSWEVVGYSFPVLQFLLVANADFVLWEATEKSFPSLRFLVVKNCDNLKEIPGCMGTQLETLEIERLRDSAVESAKIMKEARKQMQNQGEPAFILKMGHV